MELVPKSWNPKHGLEMLDLAALQDSDARAQEALRALKKQWDLAPTEPSMNGAWIRLPGFIVPLDANQGKTREFLLVPYFGACIHSPPPPANQIIHVLAQDNLSELVTMGAVWVQGKLETTRSESVYGAVGYKIRAAKVEPYSNEHK